MNDVKKDQSVDQGDEDSNDILGGISFDEKDQMIESVAEAILNRILDDERIKALKPPKDSITAVNGILKLTPFTLQMAK